MNEGVPPDPKKPFRMISLRDVAKLAGVSRMTASRALREGGHVSDNTREKVETAARQLGYLVNPNLSRVMSSVRRRDGSAAHVAFAYLNFWNIEPPFVSNPHLREFYEGVIHRTTEIGATLDTFNIRTEGISADRLRNVLTSRGVDALILGVAPPDLTDIDLDFTGFPAVCIGRSITSPLLNRVTSEPGAVMKIALQKAREQGFRRIGFCSSFDHDRRSHHFYASRYLYYQRYERDSTEPEIPPLLCEMPTVEDLAPWLKENRPDIVLCPSDIHAPLTEAAKLAGLPSRPGLFVLDWTPGTPGSGVNHNYRAISAGAVDLALHMVLHSESGIPAARRTVLLPPNWVEADGPFA